MTLSIILLNPVISTTVQSYNSTTKSFALNWTAMSTNGCDFGDSADLITFYQAARGCDPNQFPFPDIVGIPVWCLKNPYYPGQGCAQWLPYTSRSWDSSTWLPVPTSGRPLPPGLTLQDFADILQADPFVALNGNAVNVCHPIYGPNLDPNAVETIVSPPAALTGSQVNPTGNIPNSCGPAAGTSATMSRFQPYGTVQFPVPGPNGQPTTYSGNFQYSQTNTTGTISIDSHTTGSSDNTTFSYGASFPVPVLELFDFTNSISNGTSFTQTWLNQSSFTSTSGNTSTASYSITGPQLSDNYVGPATYNVYLDNVYGTYAFYSALEPPVALGTISITPLTPFPQVTVTNPVTSSPWQSVTLTNNSPYQLTMVWPAVTFSDPGFQIVNDGTDQCSNAPVAAAATCTLHIVFAPVLSDAPNTIYGATQSVNATMIAAGTENASSFQNILVTAQAPVTGTAAVGATAVGATLLPTPVQNSTEPNTYLFPASGTPPLQQAFTFKNLGSPVTFASTGSIVSSDSADFNILLNTCAGATVATSASCTFTLKYLPTTPLPPSGALSTRVTAFATTFTSPSPIPLAFAAAKAGFGALSISPSSVNISGQTHPMGPPTGFSAYITVSNNGGGTVTLGGFSGTGSVGGTLNGTVAGLTANCPATLGAGQSCSALAVIPVGQACYSGTLTLTGTPSASATTFVSGCMSQGSSAIILTGAEQSKTVQVPATYARATVTVQPVKTQAASKGSVSVKVGTFQATASYPVGATGAIAARAIVAALNVTGSPVKATASGSVVTLKSIAAGSAGNRALVTTGDAKFGIVKSGTTLTGGKAATTTIKYDAGKVNVATGGVTASATWGSKGTPQSIAVALAASINKVAPTLWTASASGGVVKLTSVPTTPASIGVNVTDTVGFAPTSFAAAMQ
jgi:hypothetical protein